MTTNASYRRTAILVASLFLVTAIGAVPGAALINPVINAPDYLGQESNRQSQRAINMSILKASIIINRPATDVFSGLTDFSKWPRWQGGLASVELISPNPLQVGSQLRQTRMGRNAAVSIMEVTQLVPNQLLGLKSPSRPFSWEGTFTLESIGNRTRLNLQFNIQATGLAGLFSDLIIRLTLPHELKAFKKMVEAG